jgi:fluoride exporter
VPPLSTFLTVCAAGALGTGARYLIGAWTADRFGVGFPYGTLAVNLIGCFAIAWVMQTAATAQWSPQLRVTLTVGLLGGFTTYSSFNFDTMALMQRAPGMAAGYFAATILGGIAAGWLGLIVARQFAG